MLRIAPPLLALVALVPLATSLPASLSAQDPGLDLPHLRAPGAAADAKVVEKITMRLYAGWDWEAARLCRELMVADEKAPLPHALLALGMRHDPNRAARHCWEAVLRKQHGSAGVQALVDALQRYFGVDAQPEIVDERFAELPPRVRNLQYVRDLRNIARAHPDEEVLPLDLIQVERARLGDTHLPKDDEVEGVLRRHHAYLKQWRAMPFEIPGYAALVARYVTDEAERARQLARLPRHPDVREKRAVQALPGLEQVGTDLWAPREATGFTLPDGFGGKATFDPQAGKPTLVVFFLGFGCAHCVAQLKDLDPKAARFRAAGIEVVSVGTDSIEQVKAAQQAAQENGVDPLHFDVLCDPKGDVFRQWSVWDQFQNEALHGTFLVDGKGRILWQDISERPFEQSDWLLGECRRLLEAWQ
ncbi:MAG: peroxiredoxin family protein [Planctomycetota bacterium]